MNTNPSVGLSSILGWATFAGAMITSIATAAAGSQAQLEGPAKWTAILGIVALAVTNAGRYLQAHALVRSSSTASEVLDDSATVLNALMAEAQANVPRVMASPDGVDSAAVPFSGAQSTAPIPPAA
jgi:hypothetical protein